MKSTKKLQGKKCSICDKTHLSVNLRSHAMNKSKRRQKANLQTRRIKGCKVKICTKCLRSQLKVKN